MRINTRVQPQQGFALAPPMAGLQRKCEHISIRVKGAVVTVTIAADAVQYAGFPFPFQSSANSSNSDPP